MRGDGGWKRLWNSPWRVALLAVGGGLAGVVYYQLVGCRTGTCALTSSAWRSAAFFALTATVAGFPERRAAQRDRPDDSGAVAGPR